MLTYINTIRFNTILFSNHQTSFDLFLSRYQHILTQKIRKKKHNYADCIKRKYMKRLMYIFNIHGYSF